MPATTASALWNTGRRVWAFLLLAVVSTIAQPAAGRNGDRSAGVSRITLESPDHSEGRPEQTSPGSVHRLIWRSYLDGLQKVSVSAPRVPGLWLRLSTDEEPFNWKFVPLENGRPKDLVSDATRARGSFRLQYDLIGTTGSPGRLPVVFTLTER